MKLDQKILKTMIRQALHEAQAPPQQGSLASGAGVTSASMKIAAKKTGEELAGIEGITPNENKIIKKFMDVFKIVAEEADMDKGSFLQILTMTYKRLGQEMKKERAVTAQQGEQ